LKGLFLKLLPSPGAILRLGVFRCGVWPSQPVQGLISEDDTYTVVFVRLRYPLEVGSFTPEPVPSENDVFTYLCHPNVF
jgi:hypothetical protein